MKRIVFVFALLLSALDANSQILYKISGNGLDKPSYILGTLHVMDGTFTDSIPGLDCAFEDVEQVCGEVDYSKVNLLSISIRSYLANYLPDSMRIDDCLDEQELDELNACLNEYYGLDLNNPIMYNQFKNLTPYAVAMQIANVLTADIYEPCKTTMIDEYMQNIARDGGKGVVALESWDFQIELMFGLYDGLDRGKELLMSYVRYSDEVRNSQIAMLEAYKMQNLDEIDYAIAQLIDVPYGHTEQEYNEIFKNRNLQWIELMPEVMSDKPTMFVVGAGHLTGKYSVLKLLKEEGYKVVAVK